MSRRDRILELKSATPVILPSILLCDFGNLEREVNALLDAGVKAIHLDVMDGVFVPNMTYGMPIVEAFRRLTDVPLDVHLMITKPEKYIDAFFEAGADMITIHAEATAEPAEVLQHIRGLGAAAGVAINPETPVSQIEGYLDHCDLVLPMSVNAGFGGQKFNPLALDKLAELRQLSADLLLEVDGGVNTETIRDCAGAGAEFFVVGSAIFRQPDYQAAIGKLCSLAKAVA